MRTIRFISLFLFLIFNFINVLTLDAEEIRFIYCSDLHYGIKRTFRGKECETYKVVDEMLKSFTLLYSSTLPSDGGAGAGDDPGYRQLAHHPRQNALLRLSGSLCGFRPAVPCTDGRGGGGVSLGRRAGLPGVRRFRSSADHLLSGLRGSGDPDHA